MKVALDCMARWGEEYLNYARQPSGEAADLGTTLHLALEMYVEHAVMAATKPATIEFLLDCYTTAYLKVMQSFDFESKLFQEGERMLRVWHDRNNFDGVTVISTESKEFFQLPYIDPADGQKKFVKFNYIIDRLDQTGEGEYRVVDYKSWRGLIGSDEVKPMLQARIYALAIQIKFPEAKKITVVIDQLRGESVGVVFKRADNAVTFRALKVVLQRIVDTPRSAMRETLNDECKWCIRKTKCKALRAHSDAGGVLDMSLDELIKLRYEMHTSAGALSNAVDAVDAQIKIQMDDIDLPSIETLSGEFRATVTGGRGRTVINEEGVPRVLGPDLALEVASWSKSRLEELKGDPRVSKETWKQVEELMERVPGKRGLRVTKLKRKSQSTGPSEEQNDWTP